GVWAMELMHGLTGFGDLYPFGGDMGLFDEMASASGTHPSAYTKAAIGWLDPTAIALHNGRSVTYDLYSVGLTQPPPTGLATAVRIGTTVPYLMVESRQRVDQFDAGIPSEGAIVYRVQTSDPLGHPENQTAPVDLLTPTAIAADASFTTDTGIVVHVAGALPGGLSVRIDDLNVHLAATADIVWHHDDTGETQIWFMKNRRLGWRERGGGGGGDAAVNSTPVEVRGRGGMGRDGRGGRPRRREE